MSYCVHCGVELSDREEKCPLCDTPVYDPWRESNEDAADDELFPHILDEVPEPDTGRVLGGLLMALFAVSLIVVFIVDLVSSGSLSWSLYVFGAEFCAGTALLVPLRKPFHTPYPCILLDGAAVWLYLVLIRLVEGKGDWLWSPATLLVAATTGAALLWCLIFRRGEMGKIAKAGWIALVTAGYLVALDLIIRSHAVGICAPSWSVFAVIPLAVVGGVLLLTAKNSRVSAWVRKKLFI